MDFPKPKLLFKFPRPVTCPGISFESNSLPPRSDHNAINCAIKLTQLRESCAAATMTDDIVKYTILYTEELKRFAVWVQKKATEFMSTSEKYDSVEECMHLNTTGITAYGWRSPFNVRKPHVVHSSLFFELAMSHIVLGLIDTIRCRNADEHFDNAAAAMENVVPIPGVYFVEEIRIFIKSMKGLAQIRYMLDDLTIETATEALNKHISFSKGSILDVYYKDLQTHITYKLLRLYIDKYVAEDAFNLACAASSIYGEHTQIASKYRQLATVTGQPRVETETWLLSIMKPLPPINMKSLRESGEHAGFGSLT